MTDITLHYITLHYITHNPIVHVLHLFIKQPFCIYKQSAVE
jgi:hypothetical protein